MSVVWVACFGRFAPYASHQKHRHKPINDMCNQKQPKMNNHDKVLNTHEHDYKDAAIKS